MIVVRTLLNSCVVVLTSSPRADILRAWRSSASSCSIWHSREGAALDWSAVDVGKFGPAAHSKGAGLTLSVPPGSCMLPIPHSVEFAAAVAAALFCRDDLS